MDDQISKIWLHQSSIFENFENPQHFFDKIREIFCFCYLFNKENSHVFYFEEKMFTNEIKDRKKGAKRPEFLVLKNS